MFSLDEEQVLNLNYSINVVKSLDRPSLDRKPEPEHRTDWYVAQIMMGVGMGCVVSAAIWVTYLRGGQIRNVAQAIKCKLLMKQMKKVLIQKGLYRRYQHVKINDKLGVGNFGEVFSATLTDYEGHQSEMAIKKLKKGILCVPQVLINHLFECLISERFAQNRNVHHGRD